MCFNLLSDNESNAIRVIWYFVMLYHLYRFNLNRLHCNKYLYLYLLQVDHLW